MIPPSVSLYTHIPTFLCLLLFMLCLIDKIQDTLFTASILLRLDVDGSSPRRVGGQTEGNMSCTVQYSTVSNWL